MSISEETERYYFAYGSNMNELRMRDRRAPYSSFAPAVLRNHVLLFDKQSSAREAEGYANVRPKEGESVHGIVYRGTERTLGILDGFEGVGTGHYRRETVTLEVTSADPAWQATPTVEATVYLACDHSTREGLRPSQGYLDHLLKAQCLPETYMGWLRSHVTLDS